MARIRRNPTLIARSQKSLLDNHEIDHSAEGYGHWGAWYRVWSDGFCEQGIITRDYWGNTTVSSPLYFAIPFADTNFTIVTSLDNTGLSIATTGSYEPIILRRTATSCVPIMGRDTGFDPSGTVHVTAQGFVSAETIANLKAGKRWSADVNQQWLDE